MLERVKFSPLPDVNYLISVTNLNTLSEWCNWSKMNNMFLFNNIFTLNPYLLFLFLICKTWNGIRLFVNKYQTLSQQLIYMYSQTCIKRPPKGNAVSGLLRQVVSYWGTNEIFCFGKIMFTTWNMYLCAHVHVLVLKNK